METSRNALAALSALAITAGEHCSRGAPGSGASDAGDRGVERVVLVAPVPMRAPAVDAGAVIAPPRPLPTAGAVVRVGAGTYRMGSMPGDPGRDPSNEVDLVAIELQGFDIDALPYPNDPSAPAQLGMTRDQAERACAARSRRLCSEIEWERACRGRDGSVFPGASVWDPQVARGEPGRCVTGEGAFGMGVAAAEFTRDSLEGRAIIRGAGREAAAALHRCAARRTAVADAPGLEVGFRCCGGPEPAGQYPREVSRRAFREEPLSGSQVQTIIAGVPELHRLNLRDGLALFSPPAITEVLNHGATNVESHPEYTFTVQGLRWSPVFGEEVLVFVARSRAGSWIAAVWILPEGRYRHAGSFLLRNDPVALALAYGPNRREVVWSSCWNCGGEHGSVTYTDENRVLITQR